MRHISDIILGATIAILIFIIGVYAVEHFSKVTEKDFLEVEYYVFRKYNYLDGVPMQEWLDANDDIRNKMIEYTYEAK